MAALDCKLSGNLKISICRPWRDLNTQPSDLESDALPLRHGVFKNQWPWQIFNFFQNMLTCLSRIKSFAPGEAWTHGLQIMRLTRCLLRYGSLLMSQNDSNLRNFILCKKCWQKWPHSRKFCRTLHLARFYCLYSPELPPHSTSRTKGKQILAWLDELEERLPDGCLRL